VTPRHRRARRCYAVSHATRRWSAFSRYYGQAGEWPKSRKEETWRHRAQTGSVRLAHRSMLLNGPTLSRNSGLWIQPFFSRVLNLPCD
jgi:hypothetical protein